MKRIEITNAGKKARINIIGRISGWRNASDEFYQKLKEIQDAGITDVEVYINSLGGSVFEANEIVNVILGFEGSVNFILGALCASAATNIVAQVITQKQGVTIEQYRNGQFMIHNVSVVLEGQITEIESSLQVMRNLQQNIVDAYCLQTKLSETVIKNMMAKETWMSAKVALEKGFITGIIDKTDTQPTNFAADITNCGFVNVPESLVNQPNTDVKPKSKEMTLEQINASTGKNFDNEADALAYLAQMQAENTRIAAERTQQAETERKQKIDNVLNEAISKKKIQAGQADTYRALLEKDFENTAKILKEMQAADTLSNKVKNTGDAATGKTYRELAENNPAALQELFENNRPEFNRLFKNEFGKDYK